MGALRAGQLPRHPAAHLEPRPALRAPDPHQRHNSTSLLASASSTTSTATGQHRLPRRLSASITRRSSITPSPVTLSANPAASSPTRRHRARSASPPASPQRRFPRFPPVASHPYAASMFVPDSPPISQQWFPTNALNGYPSAMLNPYSRAMDSEPRTEPRTRRGP